MPCRGPDTHEEVARKLRLEVDKITRILCGIANVLEGTTAWEQAEREVPHLATWWRNHQIADQRRREQERAVQEAKNMRKQALAKLTPEERKALGFGS